MSYRITVNGQIHEADVDGDMPLLWYLRDTLELTGTKYGCGRGLCGSCVVHIDGQAEKSCLITNSLKADSHLEADVTVAGIAA